MALAAADLQRLSSLLDQALDQDAREREAWLASLGQDALKPVLDALLERHAHFEPGDFAPAAEQLLGHHGPSGPSGRDRLTTAPGLCGPAAGDAIGPYRLQRELGSGGMGAVWLAERMDGLVRRPVALKLPLLGWTPGLVERFARERDILASLEHPNIARLYDAGVDALGRPWMALEYVDGEAIDVHCLRRALPLRARVHLLLQVAEAVAYAHGALVLHRDLKPANIHVDGQERVRLLDFGIAKLMHGEQADATAITLAAGRALTPDYASPEQLRGAAVGTASDVYSLGVVAFELLAGSRPYRLARGSAAALEEAITTQEVPRASDVATDPATQRALRGDLDAILAKALAKQPAERYRSVDALAQDWRRWLGGEGVLARPESRWVRALRRVRRHRRALAAGAAVAAAFALALGVSATALVIGVLMLGLTAALWQARQAAAARDRALALAARNAAGNQFLDTLLAQAARGRPVTALQLLERSERLVERQLRAHPDHRAHVFGLIADLYMRLDHPAPAESLFNRALDAARAGSDSAQADSLALRRAVAVAMLGRTPEATATIDHLLARAGLGPAERSQAHAARGRVAQFAGEFKLLQHHAEAALAAHRADPAADPQFEAVLLCDLGWACHRLALVDEAEAHYDAGMALFESLGLAQSASALSSGAHRALMVLERGDARRAIELYDELIAAWTTAVPDSVPSVYLTANRAYAQAGIGRFEEAEAGYLASAARAEEQGLDVLHYNVRMLHVELELLRRRPAAARRVFERAVAERGGPLPEGSAAEFAHQLAEAQLALAEGRSEGALKVFGLALEDRQPAAGTINALLGRSRAHGVAGAPDAAQADAQDALAFATQLQGRRPSSFRTGLAWLALAQAQAQRGEVGAAQASARAAVVAFEAQMDHRHPALAEARALASGGPAEAPA